MNTYLGVSSLLCPTDIDADTVAAAQVLYMEGYLYDRDRRPRRRSGMPRRSPTPTIGSVSLTLSDSFCVDRHRDDFRALVTDEVDLLFGNEDELMSLYEVDSIEDAVAAVRRDCDLAVDHDRRRRLHGRDRPTTCCTHRRNRSTTCSTRPAPATCSPPGSCMATRARRSTSARGSADRRRRSDLPRRSPPPDGVAYALAMTTIFRQRLRDASWLAAEPDRRHARRAGELLEPAATTSSRPASTAGCSSAPPACAPRSAPARMRMNRLVVRQAAAGLVDYLLETGAIPTRRSAA